MTQAGRDVVDLAPEQAECSRLRERLCLHPSHPVQTNRRDGNVRVVRLLRLHRSRKGMVPVVVLGLRLLLREIVWRTRSVLVVGVVVSIWHVMTEAIHASVRDDGRILESLGICTECTWRSRERRALRIRETDVLAVDVILSLHPAIAASNAGRACWSYTLRGLLTLLLLSRCRCRLLRCKLSLVGLLCMLCMSLLRLARAAEPWWRVVGRARGWRGSSSGRRGRSGSRR